MTNRASRNALACALLATSSLCLPAIARAESPAPLFTSNDDHGVDLISGLPFLKIEEGGIGSGPGRVSMQRIWAADSGFLDNWSGGLYQVSNFGGSGPKMVVQLAGISDTFSSSGANWIGDKRDGATLTVDGQGYWIYTARDGTKIKFGQQPGEKSSNCPGSDASQCRVPLSITAPNGLKFNLTWGEVTLSSKKYRRLTGVASSAGYSLAITYVTNNAGSGGSPVANWWKRNSVTFTNSANPPNPLPTINYAYPNATTIDVTDPAGRSWRFTTDSNGRLAGVRRPGSTSNDISYGYTTALNTTVSSATRDGVTNTYNLTLGGIVTITNPLGQQKIVTIDVHASRVTSFRDGANRVWSYEYDQNSRLTRITAPEGNDVDYDYDNRGNVSRTTRRDKSNNLIITRASFDGQCTNVVTCNKPNNTTDANGNVTDYSYDPVHGGVLTITRPAPALGGTRPQSRYTYSPINSASGDLVTMLTGVSACQTGSSCTGSANETKATAAYNSNLIATSISRGDGTGALNAVTTATYDARGNLDTVDGPLPGSADTIKYRYDSADQLIGIVSPDPDGAGSLKMRAKRLTYRPNGQVSKSELGTVDSQSDPDWALFAPLQTVDVTFDANSRATQQKLSAGGTDYALTQTSYDAIGRVACAAVRMNVAVYGALPASACSLSTEGSDGPDQISKTIYDAAGQVTQVQEGVGTSDAANERTLTYTENGKLQTLKDAENNLTTYEYDGFDRLTKTRYPNPTKGAGTSSTTDYELLGYDDNSNVISRRLRDGNTIAYTFDKLDRVTLKNLPGTEPDVSYGYDNLGRVTSQSQTGHALAFTYDALGRKLTETGPLGTVTSEYDLAGRRIKLTYPGSGLFVNTDYLVTGEVAAIRENDAASGVGVLGTYAYDDLGNRLSLTFGNGAVQSYTYDPVSRLASLSNDLSGTANDFSATFAYSPASQATSTVRTGDAYAFNGLVLVDRNYTSNGRNQYSAAGSATFTYDTKGNLTSDGTNAYTYSSENLLLTAPNVTSLAYDPAARLYQVSGSSTTKFAYDGLNMLSEYDGANALQRRYVFAPGMDQPITWYEGPDTTDRRFLSTDERGSIIARTASDGSLIGINTYDEYGIPGSSNAGRFQYTGQAWLGELGMSYYKARMYSPTLGRFMQTDPIGQADDLNLYAYTGNDPINLVDPFGLQRKCVQVGDGQLRCSEDADTSGFAGQGDPFHGGSTGGANTGGPPGANGDELPDNSCAAHPRACAGMTPEEADEAIVVTPPKKKTEILPFKFQLTNNRTSVFSLSPCATRAQCDIRNWGPLPPPPEPESQPDDEFYQCVGAKLGNNDMEKFMRDSRRAAVGQARTEMFDMKGMGAIGSIPLFELGYALGQCGSE